MKRKFTPHVATTTRIENFIELIVLLLYDRIESLMRSIKAMNLLIPKK